MSGRADISIEDAEKCFAVIIRGDDPWISEEALGHVLEPYYRIAFSRNRSSGDTGLGLGLAIARNMAFLNGTELTLDNRPEIGFEARLTTSKFIRKADAIERRENDNEHKPFVPDH